MYITKLMDIAKIQNSNFTNCKAQQGGAIYAQDVFLNLTSTQFIANSALFNLNSNLNSPQQTQSR